LRKAWVLVCGLLALFAVPAAVSLARFFGLARASQIASSVPSSRFGPELRQGRDLFSQARYAKAAETFGRIAQSARAAHDYRTAARCDANVGACRFALHQYQAARDSLLRARRLLESLGDGNTVAVTDANIASLCYQMGDLDAGSHWLDGAIQRLSGADRREHLAEMLLQRGVMRGQSGQMAEAEASFHDGIEAAAAASDWKLYANGCQNLGDTYFLHHNYAAAEEPLLEAYRIRKFHDFPMDSSYRSLGRLRLAQGDLASASVLLDRAVELASLPGAVTPIWQVYHARGLVREAQGRLPEALEDLGKSLRLARTIRWSAPAAEATRVGAENLLDEVYAAFIDVGNRLQQGTSNPLLLRQTFEAAEENRAVSLRAQALGNGQRNDLPPAYWEAVERLRRAEAAALRLPDAEHLLQVENGRAELTRIEAYSAGPIEPSSEHLLSRVSNLLPADAALFSFYLGSSSSWLWAVERTGLSLYRLPPQAWLEQKIAATLDAIRLDRPNADAAAAGLYAELFGRVDPRFLKKSRWLLSLDKNLFDVPFPSLVEGAPGRAEYVAQRHVTQVIPSAGYWADSVERRRHSSSNGCFLGIGDAIYNVADSRLTARGTVWSRLASWLRPGANSAASPVSLSLPRLAASAGELGACAAAWGGPSILLEGTRAARAQLVGALGRDPQIIHFAAHVLESAAPQKNRSGVSAGAYGLIALSLDKTGQAELLTPAEITHWHTRAELVVLNGCHSDAARVLPGAGMLGLTRAWLSAGARCVAGSRWDTPDEDGALFAALYRQLRTQQTPDPALALAEAQREMIRSGSWRGRPPYWGAYFMVGNE